MTPSATTNSEASSPPAFMSLRLSDHLRLPSPTLLTGSLDETVRLWLPDELTLAGTPVGGHCLRVVSVVAHPSGAVAASTSLDNFVSIFDVDTNVGGDAGGTAVGGLETCSSIPILQTSRILLLWDIALAIGKNYVMPMLQEAADLCGHLDSTDEDMLEYGNQHRRGMFEAYSSILQGSKVPRLS